MLNHPTLSKLQSMKFHGMARAFAEQLDTADIGALDFDDRFGLLVDREWTERHSRQLSNRLRRAKLRNPGACLEDVDYRHRRNLDKALFTSLGSCQWLRERLDVLITGPTGVGKSWLACALAHQACRDGYSALYLRLPRLLTELDIGRGDGRLLVLTHFHRPFLELFDGDPGPFGRIDSPVIGCGTRAMLGRQEVRR